MLRKQGSRHEIKYTLLPPLSSPDDNARFQDPGFLRFGPGVYINIFFFYEMPAFLFISFPLIPFQETDLQICAHSERALPYARTLISPAPHIALQHILR